MNLVAGVVQKAPFLGNTDSRFPHDAEGEPLFRHKPWQKVLKDTWTKLEKGDYDWAHLAMAYWPDRVCEKCKIDKSIAIAHGLEALYIEPEAKPKKARGKKKSGGLDE